MTGLGLTVFHFVSRPRSLNWANFRSREEVQVLPFRPGEDEKVVGDSWIAVAIMSTSICCNHFW